MRDLEGRKTNCLFSVLAEHLFIRVGFWVEANFFNLFF